MSQRIHLPAHLLGSSFLILQSRMGGVGYGRTRSPDLEAPFHGVRVPAGREDRDTPEAVVLQRVTDYLPRLRPGQYFCELTALALWGAPITRSRRQEFDVHIGANGPAAPPRARGVRPHYPRSLDTYRVYGAPVCSPIQAWLQCCVSLPLDELVILGDALLRRKNPLTTVDGLGDAVDAYGSGPGSRAAREAVDRIRPRTDSPKESELRLLIVDAGLPEPDVNAVIVDAKGKFLGFADLTYREYRTIVEYDGEHHFGLDAQRVHDLDRVHAFRQAEWRVIQIHKLHLAGNGSAALALIRQGLFAAGWRP